MQVQGCCRTELGKAVVGSISLYQIDNTMLCTFLTSIAAKIEVSIVTKCRAMRDLVGNINLRYCLGSSAGAVFTLSAVRGWSGS